MQINNPVHKLEANKTNRKDNARILVDIGRTDPKYGIKGAVLFAYPGKLCKIRIGRWRQTLLTPVNINEGGGGGRGGSSRGV